MTLTQQHLDMLRAAPFKIPAVPDLPHELCRRGYLAWAEGAWRLTEAGRALLLGLPDATRVA